MTRKITNFNLDKSINRISKPSIFDRLVKEVDATAIPAKYVESVIVQYHDGNIIEIKGTELTEPVPINIHTMNNASNETARKMKDVKIFISTDKLENDIDILVEQFLGKHC